MAVSVLLGMSSSTSRPYHHLHSPLFRFVPKADAYVHPKPPPLPTHFPESNDDDSKLRNWKRFSSNHLGIVTSMIPKPTRKVLNGLKKAGYEVYLVGGCVRDLILDRPPKDFDIITSAQLKEVCLYLSPPKFGRRFPICHVHIDGTIVEVSSFSTSSKPFDRHLNSAAIEKSMNCEEIDFVRWKNCLQRDFTINGMMYDPYNNVVYDYLGGMEDIRQAKVRTVVPACTSFQEDCARILRAIRIAARLQFHFAKDIAGSIKNLSCLVSTLNKARLQMEMNYLLSYGSAEASLRLLWKYGLLEILLPIQSLFSSLDKLLAPNRPCHSSLWVAVLALHVALSDQPRSPLVVATFGLAVHNGGNMMEAISIAKSINRAHNANFYELLEPQNMEVQALIDEVMDLTTSVKVALHKMTDEHFVSLALESYPQAPASDLVFIPLVVYLKVCKIFECVVEGAERGFVPKRGKINYECLALGNVPELRHVFARIVFDTVYPL
ncbi:CCA-adding enzyme [Cucumis melo var. makuwa]|uniref:CCA-adding enzyme n=1 Tax=Cucumis melo var. makuwa TaxID=1194695 RepID=A0A5D3BGP8_CUCMM|nr:CCA-adding enzyme [Cucumis melo var. makuwa]